MSVSVPRAVGRAAIAVALALLSSLPPGAVADAAAPRAALVSAAERPAPGAERAALGGDAALPAVLPGAPTLQGDPNIVVAITSPQPGQRLRGRVEIKGYAADLRSQSGSGLNERDIQIFLNDASDPWNIFDYAVPGQESPEAAAALGPRFSQAGFWDAWETCTFPEAPYKLIVWVSSVVNPGARNFATVDVYVDSCDPGVIVAQSDFANEPGGVYTMRLNGPDTRGHLIDPIFADFAAGIDARCVQASVSCSYALQFRELPGPGSSRTNSYYRFTVDPTDGTFTLGYSPPGDDPIIPIVPWTPSPTIQRGVATNHLAVIVQGNWLRLFINGQQVGEARDERRPWGQIGWTAETQTAGQPVEVLFSRFQVSTPGPAQLLAPVFPSGDIGGGPPAPGGGPPAPSRVLLRDDFTDVNSGWPRQSSDPSSRRVGYEGGEYYVVKLPGSDGSPFVTRAERFSDFLVEIDARLVAPTGNDYVYLDFRRQDDGSHYSFAVDPNDSTFELRRNTSTDGVTLIPWTGSPAIQGGGARNRLGVRAQGPEIVLFVNGQEVGRVTDGTFREGTLAFGVGGFQNSPADGRFSNLVVTSLP